MSPAHLGKEDQDQLLRLARQSVEHGIHHGKAIPVVPTEYNLRLTTPGAAFVTLEKRGNLRGCIGSVQAYRPLFEDVAKNAYNAAFHDPRFDAVSLIELPGLLFEISVLTEPEDMTFSSEADFKRQLNPGSDGLIISDQMHRALFLPSVWEKLPDTEVFLSHLKQKAGLPAIYWSDTIQVKRFSSFEFGDKHG